MSRFRYALCCIIPSLFLFSGLVHSQSEKVYFGILHSHTSYSDGSGTPSDAFNYARNTGKLDFMAITEHNHRKAEQGNGGPDANRLFENDATSGRSLHPGCPRK